MFQARNILLIHLMGTNTRGPCSSDHSKIHNKDDVYYDAIFKNETVKKIEWPKTEEICKVIGPRHLGKCSAIENALRARIDFTEERFSRFSPK